MLVLLPASEAKNTIERGRPYDPDALSFPSLGPTRVAVLDALIEVSSAPDATRRLGVPVGRIDVVRANVALRDAPAAAADEVYAGVVFDAMGLAGLDAAARRRARAWIVMVSALWGAVRPGDRIPSYRLHMCGRLPGLPHLPQLWQRPLAEVLPEAAGRHGLVVDARAADYLTAWRPVGELGERTVNLKVVREHDRTRGAAGHASKHTHGLVVRRIVTDAIDPRRPEELAEALASHFEVTLHRDDRPGRPATLHVVEARA